jgi:hypothetical protein
VKFYVKLWRWNEANARRQGYWGKPYTYKFKFLHDRTNFINKNKHKWDTAQARDGHRLFEVKIL